MMRKAFEAEKVFLLGFALLSLAVAAAVFVTSRSAWAAGLRDQLAPAELYPDPFSPPSNRVPNSSFESGVSTPDAWTPCPDAAAWDNTTPANSGTRSARVTTCAWQSDGVQYVTSGTWFFGFWHKEDSSVQWVGATLQCGGASQTVGGPAFSDSAWHYYERIVILDSACDSNLLRIQLTGSTDAAGLEPGPAGSVWYDDLNLSTGATAYGLDTQPPSVDWMTPAGNQQTVFLDCALTPQAPLKISATTYGYISDYSRKLDYVNFWRFDVLTQRFIFLTAVNFAPGLGSGEETASTTLDVCSLPHTESDISADVFDHHGFVDGHHTSQFIRVFPGGPSLWLPLVER